MRVVLITQIPPAAHGLDQLLRVTGVRYGEDAATHVLGAPAGLDVRRGGSAPPAAASTGR